MTGPNATDEMDDLNKKMFKGGLWMALLRASIRSLSLISTVILARLLVPADFGLVAMATSLIALLELATAFGFDIPLIQNQKAGRDQFDSAWTLNLCFYASLTVALVLLAHPAAAFYEEERLVDVIYVLSASFLVSGFENIGVVYFRKEMNFRQDFILQISKKLAGFCITIPLALWLRSYWALVAGMVAGNVLGVGLTYLLHPYRPRFSLRAAGELMNFSKWLILNNMTSFLKMKAPNFVIGRVSGTSALGLFTVAFEVATLPTKELVAPINRVVFPAYSKLSSDLPALRKSYLDVLAVISIAALPAGFGLSAVSEPLVDLLLGNKWSAATPIVAILALFGSLNAIQTNTGSVFNALGKPYLITIIGALSSLFLFISAIFAAVHYGVIGVAVSFLITALLTGPLTFAVVSRQLQMPATQVLSVLWRPLASSLLVFAVVGVLADNFASQGAMHAAALLCALVPVGALLYLGSMFVLWILAGRPHSAEHRLALLALTRLRRLKQAQSNM